MTINWLEADWPAPGFIKAGTTFRHGGVSVAPYNSLNLATHVGDDPLAVLQNRARLLTPAAPQWLEQTHSIDVISLPCDESEPKADAAVTTQPGIVCAAMTADCLPVLMTNTEGSCVAATHAGWRGLCDGILEATVEKLAIDPQSLLVWLGPAIGPNVYEVGQEVYDAFTKNDPDAQFAFTPVTTGGRATRHWLFDIYAMARLRLNKVGVTKIFGGGLCTYSDEENYFSYRRDGTTGRMASLIWINK